MRKILTYIGIAISAILAFLGVFFTGKNRGKKDVEAEQTKETLQSGLNTKRNIDNLRNSGDSDIDEFLRKDARD